MKEAGKLMEPSQNANERVIERKLARSGNVSFGESITVHESNTKRVTLVPFFVTRSTGTDLSVKITDHRSLGAYWSEKASISLTEADVRRLMVGLADHLEVASQPQDGTYVVLQLDGSSPTTRFGPDVEVSQVGSALLKVLARPEMLAHLQEADFEASLGSSLRAAMRIRDLRSGVEDLQKLLESGESAESIYQRWCEAHSWAFGLGYDAPDQLRRISAGDTLDVLVPDVWSKLRDLIELKRPDMKPLNWDPAHKSWYFSKDASSAIGQCHRYLDVLHQEAARGLMDHPEVVAYHPRATIVLGRSDDWNEGQFRALHGLNSRLAGISLMTYDQLLEQGRRLLRILTTEEAEHFEGHEGWDVDSLTNPVDDPDDLPFD